MTQPRRIVESNVRLRVVAVCAVAWSVFALGCPQQIRGDGSDGGPDGSIAGVPDGSTGGHDGGGSDGGGSDAGTDACVPLTCALVDDACGAVSDGCGGTLFCTCAFTRTCSAPSGGEGSCDCASTTFLARVADTGAGYTGLYSSSVIDAAGRLHAVYVDGDDGFKYLQLSTGAASYEPLVETVVQGVPVTGTAVAVDGAGVVHVVYYRWSHDPPTSNIWDAEVWYARRGLDGQWSTSRVVTAGEMVYARADYAAIALEASGTIHLLYYTFTYSHADLWHASSPNGTGWITEPVVTGTDIGSTWSAAGTVSLAAAPSGTLHALYFDYASFQLRLARKAVNGAWTVRTSPLASPAQAGDWAGAFSSMVFDAAGNAHIAYSMERGSNAALVYGVLSPEDSFTPVQVDPPVGQSARVGLYPSLTLDAAGRAHIAYYDGVGENLKYAYEETPGSPFRIETAATAGSVGAHTALAIDAAGSAHVFFFELVSESNGTGQLRYATRCH